MIDLTNRVAIVTGGASGIGRATALRLAQAGARVFAADLDPCAENQSLYDSLGIRQVPCDVRDELQVRRLVEFATADSGKLHIVVSNAGIDMPGRLPEISAAQWDDCLDVNLKASFLLCKYAFEPLQAAGGGAVVLTSSNAGWLPRAHDPVYGTSKAALIALAENLALAHAADKIRFNCVCPGPVSQTGIIEAGLAAAGDRAEAEKRLIEASPLARAYGRMITPEEVADAILYLVSDAAAMVTGTALRIDGGKSLGVPPRE